MPWIVVSRLTSENGQLEGIVRQYV